MACEPNWTRMVEGPSKVVPYISTMQPGLQAEGGLTSKNVIRDWSGQDDQILSRISWKLLFLLL